MGQEEYENDRRDSRKQWLLLYKSKRKITELGFRKTECLF